MRLLLHVYIQISLPTRITTKREYNHGTASTIYYLPCDCKKKKGGGNLKLLLTNLYNHLHNLNLPGTISF